MPSNIQVEDCVTRERGTLLFCAPKEKDRRSGIKVQIIDVFALQVATGYIRDPHGRLLLESQPSLASGRIWSVAKAAQLIRNDVRPNRWVALQADKFAWGLFWAGGGLQHCRQLLENAATVGDECSSLVPASPDALLRLVLDLQAESIDVPAGSKPFTLRTARHPLVQQWRWVIYSSVMWLVLLLMIVVGFLVLLNRQDKKLELLLDRTVDCRHQLN